MYKQLKNLSIAKLSLLKLNLESLEISEHVHWSRRCKFKKRL